MRKVFDFQMKFGEISIDKIEFDPRSRDEITKLLIGLQNIFCNREVRSKVFDVLEEMTPKNVDPKDGREGMSYWRILVLGTIRLNCRIDYDKLQELANNHRNIRLMLSHNNFEDHYPLQTIKDNVALFTPEIEAKISKIVVDHAHSVLGVKPDESLRGSCDSFPVQTDVHFPTDINMLWDALRKIILLIMKLADQLGLSGWREGISILKKTKKNFRKAQQAKKSRSKDDAKKKKAAQMVINAHLLYLEFALVILQKVKESLLTIVSSEIHVPFRIAEINQFIMHAERQIDQIRRRVVCGETIPHHEKVFSIFEEHTEWIAKGKAGVPVQLGLNVCIVKDQFGLILHHRVMQNEVDVDIAVEVIRETKTRFPAFNSCSFDKGFHSPENQEELAAILDKVILPRKGKLSPINQEIENSEEFKLARRKHSAVESSISALQNHGLDECPDHGIHGFKRYVGLAILARNIQILGHILQQKEYKRLKRAKIRMKKGIALLV